MQTTRIRFREDIALNWRIANPVLASSEPGRETDTGKFKIGDGKTAWNDLPYASADTSQILENIISSNRETNDNLTSILTILNEIQTSIRNIESNGNTSGSGSTTVKTFDEELAEMGYCFVTYITDNEPITEISKIGDFYNHLYYDKHIEQREIFMGYSLTADSNEVITSIPGKCTLYPVYVKAPDTPISLNFTVTLDGWWTGTTEDLIQESIGRGIAGLNHYSMALAGFSTDQNSIESIKDFNEITSGTTIYGPVVILGYDKRIRTVTEVNDWYNEEINGPYWDHMVNVHKLNGEVEYTTLINALNAPFYNINNVEYSSYGFSLDTTMDNIITDTSALLRDSNTVNITDLYVVYNVYDHSTGQSELKHACELTDLYDVILHSLTENIYIKYNELDNYTSEYNNYGITFTFLGFTSTPDGLNENNAVVTYTSNGVIENNFKEVYIAYTYNNLTYVYASLHPDYTPTIMLLYTIDRESYWHVPHEFVTNFAPETFVSNNQTYTFYGWSITSNAQDVVTEYPHGGRLYPIMNCDGTLVDYYTACTAYTQRNTVEQSDTI